MLTPGPPQTDRWTGHWIAVAACGVVGLGVTLRAWNASAGAPFRLGADEPFIISTALRMLRTGDFNPHFFDYGGLTIYLHTLTAGLAFLGGAMLGYWNNLSAVWEGDLLVPGRLLSAAFGGVTIACVYRIGLRWGPGVALLAAAVMAVMPAHIREAHFILTDTPLTTFMALSLLLSIRAVERRQLGDVALAATAVGLATAIKYNGAVAMLMPALAALTLAPGSRLAALALVPVVAGLTFLACAPYTVLDLPGFLNGMAHLAQSYNQQRPFDEAARIYLAYLRNWFTWPGVLPASLGYVALSLAVVGFGSLFRGSAPNRRMAALLVLVFSVTYFLFVATQSLQYGRYLLPIGPPLALALAAGLSTLAGAIPSPVWRRRILIGVTVLVLTPPMATAVTWVNAHGRTTTAELTAQWLVDHATPADRIVMEDGAFRLPPRLPLTIVRRLIDRSLDQYQQDGVTLLVATSVVSDRYHADPVGAHSGLAAHRDLLARTLPVATIVPDADHPGATFTVLRLSPASE